MCGNRMKYTHAIARGTGALFSCFFVNYFPFVDADFWEMGSLVRESWKLAVTKSHGSRMLGP